MELDTPEIMVKEPRKVAECGTPSGYQRHRVNNEETCAPCKAANTAARKAWGEKNRKRHNEIAYAWNSRNPDKVNSNMRNVCRRRRARKLSVESEPYTQELILEKYGSACHICQEEIDLTAPQHPMMGVGWEKGLQLDHVISLYAGGTDTIENIRPAHVRCNIIKGK